MPTMRAPRASATPDPAPPATTAGIRPQGLGRVDRHRGQPASLAAAPHAPRGRGLRPVAPSPTTPSAELRRTAVRRLRALAPAAPARGLRPVRLASARALLARGLARLPALLRRGAGRARLRALAAEPVGAAVRLRGALAALLLRHDAPAAGSTASLRRVLALLLVTVTITWRGSPATKDGRIIPDASRAQLCSALPGWILLGTVTITWRGSPAAKNGRIIPDATRAQLCSALPVFPSMTPIPRQCGRHFSLRRLACPAFRRILHHRSTANAETAVSAIDVEDGHEINNAGGRYLSQPPF